MKTAKRNVPVFSVGGDYIIGEIGCGQETLVLGETQEGTVIAYILGIVKPEHSGELVEEELWESTVSEKHRLLRFADENEGYSGSFSKYLSQREQEGKNLYGVCTPIETTDIRAGDLVFESGGGCIGVYMGDGSAVVEREGGILQRKELSAVGKADFGRPKHSAWNEEDVYYTRRLRKLKKHMQGDDVREVQKALGDSGLYKGKNDGVFCRRTQKAVKRFQGLKGLKASGTVDCLTWESLLGR